MSKELDTLLSRVARQKEQETANRRDKTHNAGAKQGLFFRMADLYRRMQEAYAASAAEAGLSCGGCEENCCTSYFQHHTYVEWAYLWRGLNELPESLLHNIVKQAEAYLDAAKACLAANTVPRVMCPLNEKGLCILYPHRLMICRMHGTRNLFTLPDGRQQIFPGCYRFQALPGPRADADNERPALDRTPFYRELAGLEMEFLRRAKRPMPRVNLTLAEMILLGPPKLQ